MSSPNTPVRSPASMTTASAGPTPTKVYSALGAVQRSSSCSPSPPPRTTTRSMSQGRRTNTSSAQHRRPGLGRRRPHSAPAGSDPAAGDPRSGRDWRDVSELPSLGPATGQAEEQPGRRGQYQAFGNDRRERVRHPHRRQTVVPAPRMSSADRPGQERLSHSGLDGVSQVLTTATLSDLLQEGRRRLEPTRPPPSPRSSSLTGLAGRLSVDQRDRGRNHRFVVPSSRSAITRTMQTHQPGRTPPDGPPATTETWRPRRPRPRSRTGRLTSDQPVPQLRVIPPPLVRLPRSPAVPARGVEPGARQLDAQPGLSVVEVITSAHRR